MPLNSSLNQNCVYPLSITPYYGDLSLESDIMNVYISITTH